MTDFFKKYFSWKVGLILFTLFVISFALTYRLSKPSSFADAPEVDWRLLGKMDYISQFVPENLKIHDGKLVKIPGFMVPLEDNSKKVVEFLLVPSPQACIHVPPPPPNQMVYAKMEKGTEAAFGPIWVYGILHISPKRHMFGEASFTLEAQATEPYK